MSTTITKRAIPPPRDPANRTTLDAVVGAVNELSGTVGSAMQRAVRVCELVDAGILQLQTNNQLGRSETVNTAGIIPISDVIGLQAALDGRALTTTSFAAGTGLTGGGTLAANRTFALDTAYTDARYPLLTAGKISVSVLPSLAITDTFPVASQAAMLALVAERGDVAVRSDLNQTFILSAEPASTLANWTLLLTPTDSVQSVAGRTGVITLTKADVGLGSVDNTSDASKPVSTAQATAIALKANIANPAFTGSVGVGGTNNGSYGAFEVRNAGYAALAVASSDASGVTFVVAANAANELRLNVVTAHPMAIYTSGVERARFHAAGGLNVVGAITQNGQQVHHTGNFDPATKANLANPSFTTRVYATGGFESIGGLAELAFQDRTTARRWLWYGSGDIANFYNGSASVITITPSGATTFQGDLTTVRSAAPTTGVVYLGNSGARYLFYDGSAYVMPGASLWVNGAPVWTSATFDPATKLNVGQKAADSELLDGIDSSRVVFGSTANKTNDFGGDWNTAMPSGFYEASAAINGPVAGWNWCLNVRHSNTSNHYGFQLNNPIGTNDLYLRGISNGVVQTWGRLWHSQNFDPTTKANLTGGTFTGEVKTTVHYRMANQATGANDSVMYAEGNILRFYQYGIGDLMHVRNEGRIALKNANSTTMTTQPRTFVQSTDPGAAAADGDLWFW